MKSHELLREVFATSNPKQIAEDLGLSLSMIYKWSEASGEGLSGTTNPLDRVATLNPQHGPHRRGAMGLRAGWRVFRAEFL
jgi:hypothetical protein